MGDVFDQAAQTDTPTDVFDAAAKTPSGGIGQTAPPPDVAHQPASLSGVVKTLGSSEGLKAVADPITGFIKGIGDTVHGTGELIRKAGNAVSSGAGDKIVPPVGQTALDKMSTDTNGAQHVGKALENVAEFMSGEGVVGKAGKALSMGERIEKLGAIGKFLEAHPVVAKMLATGTKTGVVSGAQTTVKTGSPTEGAVGAAVGAPLGAAGEAAGHGVKYVRELYKPLMDVTEGTIDPAAGTVHPQTGLHSPLPGPKDVRTVQPVVQQGIRDVMTDVAGDAKVNPSSARSIRDVVAETAENVKSKSKPIFQKLDELSQGKFGDAQAEAKRYRGAIDKAGKDAYALALKKQDVIFDHFKGSFDPGALETAKSDWKQYRALLDVDDAINKTTVGQRPEISSSSASKQPGEDINPKMLLKKLNDLYHDGTLETAVGKDAAHKLLEHAGSAQSTIESIKDYNQQLLSANRSRNLAKIESNRLANKATVARNQAANTAVVEANKAKNAAIVSKRDTVKHVAGYGAAAIGGTLAGYGVKKALSSQGQ